MVLVFDLTSLVVLFCAFKNFILFLNIFISVLVKFSHILERHVQPLKVSFLLRLEMVHLFVFSFELIAHNRLVADVGHLC